MTAPSEPAPAPDVQVEPLAFVPSTTPFDAVPIGGQYSRTSPIVFTISVQGASPTGTQATVTYRTDIPAHGQFTWWPAGSQRPPDPVAVVADTGQAIEGSDVLQHSQSTNAALIPGQRYNFDLLATSTAAGVTTPIAYRGSFLMPGARAALTPPQVLPVRFFNFGSTGSPPAGGGGVGNWSTYTWAQWNPKGTAFPN